MIPPDQRKNIKNYGTVFDFFVQTFVNKSFSVQSSYYVGKQYLFS